MDDAILDTKVTPQARHQKLLTGSAEVNWLVKRGKDANGLQKLRWAVQKNAPTSTVWMHHIGAVAHLTKKSEFTKASREMYAKYVERTEEHEPDVDQEDEESERNGHSDDSDDSLP
jgi:hypothetical protein